LYGAGAGGSGATSGGTVTGASGAQGIIVITYTPAGRRTILKPVNNLGLLGYWPMNEGSGNRVADNSGFNNFGTTTSNQTWVNGKFGKALNFNGTTDYVNMGNITSMNGLSGVTVAAWVKSSASGVNFGPETHWADKSGCGGSVGDGPFELYKQSGSNTAGFAIYDGSGGEVSGSGTTNVDDGKWHFVLGDYNGVSLSIWVDGNRENFSNNYPSVVLPSTNKIFNVGGYCGSQFLGWNGTIDEVRVYNRGLATSSITALYNSGASHVNTSSATLTNGSTLTSGLVGHWTFDGPDLTATTASDRSGNGNNGTLTNGPTPTIGKLGQALSFNGSSSYVNVSNTISGIQTVAFWVKGGNTTQKIMDFNGTQSIETVSGTITANNFSSPTIYVDGAVASTIDTKWHHVVITTGSSFNGSATTLGKISSGFFSGALDDVRVYSRALSASEVKQLYALGTANIVRSDCTQSAAFLARTSGLNATHTKAYQNLICGLVTDGVWAKLDVLYVFATANSTAALTNLVSSSFTATANASPTFTADSGYTIASVASQDISSNYNFSTNGTNYTQNSASMGGWSGTAAGSAQNTWETSTAFGGNTFIVTDDGGVTDISINDTAKQTVTNNSDGSGMFVLVRPDSNTKILYRNGVSLGSTSRGSTALENGVLKTGGDANWTGIVRAMFAGGALTATDAANFYSRMSTYMTAVGATP
jgi:Concanavalin A-like lectin/glucanases superfamily